MNSKDIKKVLQFIHLRLEAYKPITNKDADLIRKFIKENKFPLSVDQIIEIRNVYMYLLSKIKGTLASKLGEKIFNRYKNRESIIEIAKKYSLPPFSVLYQVLIELKNETHVIEKILQKPDIMPPDLKKQLKDIKNTIPGKWLTNYYPIIKKVLTHAKKIGNATINGLFISYDKITVYRNKIFIWIEICPHILFDHTLQSQVINKINIKYKNRGPGIILFPNIICSTSFLKNYNNVYTFSFLL